MNNEFPFNNNFYSPQMMSEISAISKITKVNNINLSKKITDALGWLPEDEVLEKTSNGKVILTNLTIEEWKNTELSVINSKLYTIMENMNSKVVIITYDRPDHGGRYPYQEPHNLISYFTQQFKGQFLDGQISLSESILEHYYPNGEHPNDARGNQNYRFFIREMKRFSNHRTIDKLTVFDYNYLKHEDDKKEFKSHLIGNSLEQKIILIGYTESWKDIVRDFDIQDYVYLNTYDFKYHEVIEGKQQVSKTIEF